MCCLWVLMALQLGFTGLSEHRTIQMECKGICITCAVVRSSHDVSQNNTCRAGVSGMKQTKACVDKGSVFRREGKMACQAASDLVTTPSFLQGTYLRVGLSSLAQETRWSHHKQGLPVGKTTLLQKRLIVHIESPLIFFCLFKELAG